MLTQKQINAIDKNGRYRVADNLYFLKQGNSGYYILRIKINKIRRDISLGSSKTISLAVAKQLAHEKKQQLRSGSGVFEDNQENKVFNGKTFSSFALATIKKIATARQWKNKKHANQWISTVETYAMPIIGDMLLSDITRDDILAVLTPIWKTKTETASRLRSRLEVIFDYAIYEGLHPGPNPAIWRANLAMILPPEGKIKIITHHEAISFQEAKSVARHFINSPFLSHQAILFGLLTASRVQEFLFARWDEFNLKKKIWFCPAERRKDGKPYPHRVPLSDQTIFLLNSMNKSQDFLFYSHRTLNGVLNTNTPRHVLSKFVGHKVTMHGCRSTFRDWCALNHIDRILAEKALMHSTGNEVEQAYQRSDLLEQRRDVMQKWANALFSHS